MEHHSSDTISEIVANAENMPDESEPDDTLDNAVAEVPSPGTFVPQPASIADALKNAPNILGRREEAQIPEQLSVKDLVGKTFVIVDKIAQKAALPDTGEMRNGFQCLCADVETGKSFTVWVGQVALLRDLTAITLPVRVTINKHGRTYRFE